MKAHAFCRNCILTESFICIFQLFTLREQQTKSRHSSGSTEDGRHSVKDTTSPPPGSDHIIEKDLHPKVCFYMIYINHSLCRVMKVHLQVV